METSTITRNIIAAAVAAAIVSLFIIDHNNGELVKSSIFFGKALATVVATLIFGHLSFVMMRNFKEAHTLRLIGPCDDENYSL